MARSFEDWEVPVVPLGRGRYRVGEGRRTGEITAPKGTKHVYAYDSGGYIYILFLRDEEARRGAVLSLFTPEDDENEQGSYDFSFTGEDLFDASLTGLYPDSLVWYLKEAVREGLDGGTDLVPFRETASFRSGVTR